MLVSSAAIFRGEILKLCFCGLKLGLARELAVANTFIQLSRPLKGADAIENLLARAPCGLGDGQGSAWAIALLPLPAICPRYQHSIR